MTDEKTALEISQRYTEALTNNYYLGHRHGQIKIMDEVMMTITRAICEAADNQKERPISYDLEQAIYKIAQHAGEKEGGTE